MDNLFAYTHPGGSYPGYVSINRLENGDVSVTVRAAPTEFDGVYVCANASDRGQPGHCFPGDDTCNNYCNMAPQQGPMQDYPLPARRRVGEARPVIAPSRDGRKIIDLVAARCMVVGWSETARRTGIHRVSLYRCFGSKTQVPSFSTLMCVADAVGVQLTAALR